MLIKQTTDMTPSEQAAIANTNDQYLRMLCVMPMGVIYRFVGQDIPKGYMACNGAELTADDYPDLFNAIGYSYGGTDGVFYLPIIDEHIIKVADTDIKTGFEYVDSAISLVNESIENTNRAVKEAKDDVEKQIETNHSLFANALKGSGSGSVVSVKDVSPLAHEVKVKLTSTAVTLAKGNMATTPEALYPAPDIPEGWIALNDVADFNINTIGEYYEIPDENSTNFYCDFSSIDGDNAGLILSNGTSTYCLYLVGSDGGTVACYIDGTKVYYYTNGSVEEYDVEEGTVITQIRVNGMNFSSSPTLYNCYITKGFANPDGTLTVGSALAEKGASVSLTEPAQSVRVVLSGVAYCVGGIVPQMSVDDLTQSENLSDIAIVPHGMYAEWPGVYDLVYTVSGTTLSWEGTKTIPDYGGSDPATASVSGSYTLSSEGQTITGFCQVYGLDTDNPNHQDAEYDELDVDISVYEGATVATKLKVMGKNLFDISKVKTFNPNTVGYSVVNNGDGTITVTTSNVTSTTATAPNTLRDYAPDLKVGETYYLSAYSTPVEGSSYVNNFIYLPSAINVKTWYFNKKRTITEEDLNSKVLWYAWGQENATTTISNIQMELGTTATEYEPYREPETYTVNADGTVEGIEAIYPSMTFIPETDLEGVTVEVEYNRDINKAFAELQAAIISMGGNA